MPRVFVGTSGWNYDHWRGPFYPDGLPKNRWLGHYMRFFASVEVNSTFYRTMRPSTFEKWGRSSPVGFVWSLKASRFITHIRRLRDTGEPLRRFEESVSLLGEKLGPILFQLPPSLAFDRESAAAFLRLRPSHELWAIEGRHPSWARDEALACLEEAGVSWCISDTAGRYPLREAVTAPFVYLRLHGSKRLYASCYTKDELETWAGKILSYGRDAYVYFDNDFMGYAPKNALELMHILEAYGTLCIPGGPGYYEG
ncbi:MAG TPA: DUF72 domain-containing protein [Deltaproteobacteria bacterium]|nr:DUF72 domain-containing protein [Deltaproteobacteria bacterium]HOM29229.1 DUF72 domain-containing protein [Deltaproteobacteria bacterium]HPP79959.1 DUF72 domain-containing protein [Deltaproteobacteria bacterium]